MHQYRFVSVVPRSATGMLVFTVLSTLSIAAVFAWMFGVFTRVDFDRTGVIGDALFFASLITYTLVAGAYVVRRSSQALEELRPALTCDDGTYTAIRESIDRASLSVLLAFLLIGAAGGMHVATQYGRQGDDQHLVHGFHQEPYRLTLTCLAWHRVR